MAPIRGMLALALTGALAGCSLPAGDPGPTPTPTVSSVSSASSALSGFGGPRPSPAAAIEVEEAMFRTPSANIACALTKTDVRCDIVRKSWAAPAKPAGCELDWGNGLAISGGEATVTCAGDTLVGTSRSTLDYGAALRAGTIRCDSESTGLTCKDEKTGHGFTLASTDYKIF